MTRLAHPRYIELLRTEGDLLASTAMRDVTAPVPACPGWDVREAVRHTGSVYRHKVACITLGREPKEREWSTGPPRERDAVRWFRESLGMLLMALSSRHPQDPAYTWWPAEQTVGFWARRMALETVVHRADVETAFGPISVIAPDLAVDGIDEVLQIFLTRAVTPEGTEVPKPDEPQGSIAVRAGGGAWTVRLRTDRVMVEGDTPYTTDASLGGDAGEVLMYLWGRGPVEPLDCDGDVALVHSLRRRLALATT